MMESKASSRSNTAARIFFLIKNVNKVFVWLAGDEKKKC